MIVSTGNSYGDGSGYWDGAGDGHGSGCGVGFVDGAGSGEGDGNGAECAEGGYSIGYPFYRSWLTVLGAPRELREYPLEAHRWVLYPNKREQIMGFIALKEVTL